MTREDGLRRMIRTNFHFARTVLRKARARRDWRKSLTNGNAQFYSDTTDLDMREVARCRRYIREARAKLAAIEAAA